MRTQAPFPSMSFDSSSPLGILDRIGWWGALGMIAVALAYTFFMLIASRGAPGAILSPWPAIALLMNFSSGACATQSPVASRTGPQWHR